MTPRVVTLLKFVASPSYFAGRVAVTWAVRLTEVPITARVHIMRSTTSSAGPWERRTPVEGLPLSVEFLSDVIPLNANELGNGEISYKIVVTYQLAGQAKADMWTGPSIGLFGIVDAREFKILRSFMREELRQMNVNRRGLMAGGGRLVVMFAPDVNGEPDPKYDYSAAQVHGDTKYGGSQGFIGGWVTWFRPVTIRRDVVELSNTGSEIQDNSLTARMLAMPVPKIGYVVTDPHTDEWWVVYKSEIVYATRGMIPVAANVELALLQITDLRRKIPVAMPDYPVFQS